MLHGGISEACQRLLEGRHRDPAAAHRAEDIAVVAEPIPCRATVRLPHLKVVDAAAVQRCHAPEPALRQRHAPVHHLLQLGSAGRVRHLVDLRDDLWPARLCRRQLAHGKPDPLLGDSIVGRRVERSHAACWVRGLEQQCDGGLGRWQQLGVAAVRLAQLHGAQSERRHHGVE